jgi:CheY-like chemotaxis protein
MNLLTDLLDLGQVEAGRMRIEMRPFDLQPMLDQVADWWYSSANEKGLRLNITLDTGLPERVITDPVRLQQILNNFLSNALKYTDAGHVVLSVEQVAQTDTSTRLRFSVTDTGIGMSEAQLGNLFKPFVQIESDFGKERGGWGLGLSICRNIADMMGAEIGVTSTPGQGSAFHFELDMATAPAPDLAPDVKGVPASGLRILIAEDNAMNQDVMRTMLRDFGHEVVTVSNGFEAVEAMLKGRFDVVLMDITMPGLDGLGATEQIRNADGQMRRVPIVACSAHVGADVQDRYRRAGIDDFLSKPVDRDALAEMILRVVAQT